MCKVEGKETSSWTLAIIQMRDGPSGDSGRVWISSLFTQIEVGNELS